MIQRLACVLSLVALLVLAPGAKAQVATDIVLCLDVSGSISSTELNLEIDGLKACLNDQTTIPQDGSVAVAVVVYGQTAANALAALTPVTAANLTNVIEPVLDGLLTDSIVNTGFTNVGGGLINSRAILAGGTGLDKFILLVGDGESNTGPDVPTECANTAAAGITICAIAVGASSGGQAELQSCALATGGSYGNAPTFNDFLPVCQECIFVIVVGQIQLTPQFATNPINTPHTVFATVREGTAPNDPIPGVTVNFMVISGPNTGDAGSDVTDGSGVASFTYTGDGGPGVDLIQASYLDTLGNTISSNTVQKTWTDQCVPGDVNLVLGDVQTIDYSPPLWTVQVRLTNQGPGGAFFISATMNHSIPWLQIPDPTCDYGDLLAGQSSYGGDTYTFDLTNYPGGSFNVWFDVFYEDECQNDLNVFLDPDFLSPQATSVGSGDVPLTTARLLDNRPNPFNPTTSISIEIPVAGPAELTVYNPAGQVVKTLWAGDLSVGPHTFTWNGTSDQGTAVPSGTYFYKLTHDGVSQSKRMMLVR